MKKSFRQIIREWKESTHRGDTNILIDMLERNERNPARQTLARRPVMARQPEHA